MKEAIRGENHRGFELVSFLNVLSLFQESTSFVITTQEKPLSSSQKKDNLNLNQRLLQTQAFLAKSDPTVRPYPLLCILAIGEELTELPSSSPSPYL